jgi:hypothetical protein
MNPFVDYLNSMNNANSNTIAALAESQVLSPFYKKIQIERRLGAYIAERIRSNEKITVILTGHAGDGKTSILVQVLMDLNMLTPNTPLKEEESFTSQGISLYAVKDMSELPEEKQLSYCKKALESPQNNQSAIVISNTGPLLKCFEEIRKSQCEAECIDFTENEKNELQNIILSQLDSNDDSMISIVGYDVLMINMARVDNVSFAEKILDKLLADELWNPCNSCEKKEKCHIYFNVQQVKKYQSRVLSFINAFYRNLYENDKRMTIRQMISQISFSITGNHSCADIKIGNKDSLKFKYLFSNLFFGYCGLDEIENADQIQGVAYAKNLNLDAKGLKHDYQLFVTGDFSVFPLEIKEIVEKQYKLFSKRHLNLDEENEFNERDFEYRKAIRRAYIFFEQETQDSTNIKYNPLYDELFGIGFNSFIRMQDSQSSHSIIKKMEKTIVDALYFEMTGTSSKQSKEIPLTIKRDDDNFQNVLITTGSLKKSDLKIVMKNCSNEFEDSCNKNNVILKICNDEEFKLNLPMILYFGEIANGAVSTISNPSLTHGLSKLKAILEKNCILNSDDDSISIIVNNTNDPMDMKIYIDEDKLYID